MTVIERNRSKNDQIRLYCSVTVWSAISIEDLLDKSDAANFDTVFCEEPRIAYDRVHLSSYFSHHTAEELSLARKPTKTRHQSSGRGAYHHQLKPGEN